MPVPLILCRLKDDPDTTMLVGETALIHFPDWEPVPDEGPDESEPESSKAPANEPEPASSKAPAKTAGARTKAAASAEKGKE